MATGRIGVTPTLRTRWSKAPSAGTTSLSGLDDNSVSLVYDVGYEAVYRNGVLLSRGNDYTATNGTTVTLIDATIAGDIIEILANQLVPLTDAISKGQFTAKGALLSATAASTPGVLTVGSNDQVLTADSTTSTGLKWATPAAGGKVLQVVSTTKTDTFTTTSSTFVDITGLSVNITPSSATSKVLVLYNVSGTGDVGNQIAAARLMRDSTAINVGAAAGSRAQATSDIFSTVDELTVGTTVAGNFLDSPATTSALTYKFQLKTTGSTAYINRSESDVDSVNRSRTVSTITVMEIGA